MLSRRSLQGFARLAACVMLGLALAPTVSRALVGLGMVPPAAHGVASQHARPAGTAHAGCDEADAATADAAHAAPRPPAHSDHHTAHSDRHTSHTQPGEPAALGHDHFDHCPLCAVAATPWTVAPPPPGWNNSGRRTAELSAVDGADAPRAVPVGRAHRPRGPPVVS